VGRNGLSLRIDSFSLHSPKCRAATPQPSRTETPSRKAATGRQCRNRNTVPQGGNRPTEMQFDAIFSRFIAYQGKWALMKRGGHPLLLLPASRHAARRTLDLFQPQRIKARAVMAGLRVATELGLHRALLPQVRYSGGQIELHPPLPEITVGTCGFLFGSPDHRIHRAIACYETPHGWEVAKIAFGEAGAQMLEREAAALSDIAPKTQAAPSLLGLHQCDEATVLRMPYLTGAKLHPGEVWGVARMLRGWVSDKSPAPIQDFSEWSAIMSALDDIPGAQIALEKLAGKCLVPTIRHGDFTRWNLLKQPDGGMMVIDWEWGHAHGMPAIDLVHYLAQDLRLVKRLPPQQVIESVAAALQQEDSRQYLEQVGWGDDIDALILAAIAYPVGAKHQENPEVLQAALRQFIQPLDL
jgi:hypothetical protein